MRGDHAVATRLNDEELRRLDRLVKERKSTRYETLRALIRHEVLEQPSRLQLEEALDLLDAKARAGNVQAIIKTVERLTRARAAPADPFGDFQTGPDELAERRRIAG